MTITLNGQAFEISENATIASLVQMRQASGHLTTPAYAVERNKEVVFRQEHARTRLSPGDTVEIVVMVGGG
ncbi:MAG TPA: sulfur carrier protein ThiS [Phycisphaerae bacterium]|nr:sulfur carrier protein ThiS [Phycisphaerae bacterium]